ncbi:MAG: YtxH domain-containing protein [Lysinibacillus sp.]
MKAKSFLIGLTAGIVGGTIAVMLSTPQSGQQLRSTIKVNSASTKYKLQDVKDQISQVKQAVTHLKNESKNNIPLIINNLKQTIQTFTTEIEPTKNNLQQEIESLQNSISEIEKNFAQYSNKSN